MPLPELILLALAGVCGLLGVGLSAAAAHMNGADSLKTAAQFLLIHAPALLGLAVLGGTGLVRSWGARLAGFAVALGLALFCGDLALRALAARPLFPMAAPIGGVVLMGGWLAVVGAALLAPRRSSPRGTERARGVQSGIGQVSRAPAQAAASRPGSRQLP